MGLSQQGFIDRLKNGWTVNCVYTECEFTGLISAWRYDDLFVLTWEECQQGNHFNEHDYSRDERHEFSSAEEVLTFVEQSGFPTSRFSP